MKKYIALFFVLCFSMTSIVYARPKMSKDKIPKEIPYEVRVQIEKLYSWDGKTASDACDALGELHDAAVSAIPFLIEETGDYSFWDALNEQDSSGAAINALVKIGEPAVGDLIVALKDKNWNVRYGAIHALRGIKDRREVEPLIGMLNDKVEIVRESAVVALNEFAGHKLEFGEHGSYYVPDFGVDVKKWKEWWAQYNRDK